MPPGWFADLQPMIFSNTNSGPECEGRFSMPSEVEPKPVIAPHTAEGRRLAETYHDPLLWRRWGPYVSERSWGTVREDYSEYGSAWDFLSHDMARSKAYRWGEDGM